MVLSRRLTKLERDLDPEAALLRWLAEAQEFPSITEYARWLVGQPDTADPAARMLDQIEEATREAPRGHPPDSVARGLPRALRGALFAYHLVLRLNIDTADLIEVEGLRAGALMSRMRELSLREELAAHGQAAAWAADAAGLDRAWRAWREAAGEMLVGLYAAQGAREALERRYLAGHESLFSAPAEAWRDLLDRAEALYAVVAGAHHGPSRSLDALRVAARDRSDGLEDRLVRMAWFQTRAALGEEKAAATALRRLLVG